MQINTLTFLNCIWPEKKTNANVELCGTCTELEIFINVTNFSNILKSAHL